MNLKDKKADYYSRVHATQVEKIAKPTDHFKNYVLALLGDRDYETVIETVSKIDKVFEKDSSSSPSSSTSNSPPGDGPYFPPAFYNSSPAPGSRAPLFLPHPTGLGPTPFPRGLISRGFVCNYGNKEGRRNNLFCNYCGKNNHTENRCFSKQKDKK